MTELPDTVKDDVQGPAGEETASQQLWEVVGGVGRAGILVRTGEDLDSPWAAGRLATGAVVREVAVRGDRLKYIRLTGHGPQSGWVSIRLPGDVNKELLVRREGPWTPPKELTPAGFGIAAPSKNDCVWIFAIGTHGDQQPYLALALALREAGYFVRLFGAPTFRKFESLKEVEFEQCGKDWKAFAEELAAHPERYPTESWEKAANMKSMDMMGRGIYKWMTNQLPKALNYMMELLESKRPDLLIYNHLGVNLGLAAWRKWGVRTIQAHLGTEAFSVPEGRTFDHEWFVRVERLTNMQQTYGIKPVEEMSKREFRRHFASPDKLFAASNLTLKVFTANQMKVAKYWSFTGYWALDENIQVSEPGLTGGSEQFLRLQSFVASGPPPVYMGWGSMTRIGPEHLISLALTALMENNMRAVISAGWVGLNERAMLNPYFQQYAEKNVCFVTSAPHAWLFPRCYCTVHHGGAGTTAASLIAGTPTIVTPIVYDQFEHARLVNMLGVGVGMEYLGQVTAEQLSRSLRVVAGRQISNRIREVKEQLKAEPGVWGAVAAIGGIIAGDVRTGAAKKRWQAERDGQVPAPSIRLPRLQRRGTGHFLKEYNLCPDEGLEASDSDEDTQAAKNEDTQAQAVDAGQPSPSSTLKPEDKISSQGTTLPDPLRSPSKESRRPSYGRSVESDWTDGKESSKDSRSQSKESASTAERVRDEAEDDILDLRY